MCWISVLPVRLHWGASVEDSKGAFHEFRHTVLVEEKSLKHEDTDHLNPSLWKPSMPVKPHSDGGGEIRARQVNSAVHRLTSQVRCLPVSQEGAWSDGQWPQCLFLVRWCDGEDGTGNSVMWTQKTWAAGSYMWLNVFFAATCSC